MARVTVLIFHRPASAGDPELARLLADVRSELVQRHSQMFRRAGARDVHIVDVWHEGMAFGEVLAAMAPARGGLVVLGGGAVPLLKKMDAVLLAFTAGAPERIALTNNRYSSDVVAIAKAKALASLPALPSDNALPRWLEERAGYFVGELRSRDRLGLDLDTPQDVALVALAPVAGKWLRDAAAKAALAIPRLAELRELTRDPHRELLVFGRSSARTLRWLERNVRCRVRFLAEERGMRASSPLAIAGAPDASAHSEPRSTLGYLLAQRGPESLTDIVADLADGAIIDSRVLMAQQFGGDQAEWPSANDRFASDLHRAGEIADPWLRALTQAAADSRLPVLLGGHSLVGPGIPVLLGEG